MILEAACYNYVQGTRLAPITLNTLLHWSSPFLLSWTLFRDARFPWSWQVLTSHARTKCGALLNYPLSLVSPKCFCYIIFLCLASSHSMLFLVVQEESMASPYLDKKIYATLGGSTIRKKEGVSDNLSEEAITKAVLLLEIFYLHSTLLYSTVSLCSTWCCTCTWCIPPRWRHASHPPPSCVFGNNFSLMLQLVCLMFHVLNCWCCNQYLWMLHLVEIFFTEWWNIWTNA